MVKTLQAVAKHFGVSRRTLAEWKANGAPLARAPFDVKAIERWRKRTILKMPTSQINKLLQKHKREVATILGTIPDEVLTQFPRIKPSVAKTLQAAIRREIDKVITKLGKIR